MLITNGFNNDCRRYISQFVEAQFPMLYREQGRELIDFLETYFVFEEETKYQFLNTSSCMPEKDDIDTTLDEYVVFFKNKYMKDMPFMNSVDNRFIVKHIFDLYQSKGTERSLKLLMQLMYGEEIDVYYPDQDVFRPSHSIWHKPQYLELSHSDKTKELIGKRIYGSSSKASAFVETVVTKRINGRLFDVVYLSDVRGAFWPDEYLSVDGTIIFDYPFITGSLSNIIIPPNDTSGYSIGDLLDVKSDCGDLATVRVTEIESTGVTINFDIAQLGYGFAPTVDANGTLISSITHVYTSDSILSIPNSGLVDGDVISQYFLDVTVNDTTGLTVGTYVDAAQSGVINSINGNVVSIECTPSYFTSAPTSFTVNGTTYTVSSFVQREATCTIMESSATTVWGYNTIKGPFVTSTYQAYVYDTNGTRYPLNRVYGGSGASFQISTITNPETITLNTDIIKSLNTANNFYTTLPINSLDYFFPAANTENLSTVIIDAFTSITTTVGSVATLAMVNPGYGYESDVKVKVVTPLLVSQDIHDVTLGLSSITGFAVGQLITGANGAVGQIIAMNNGANELTVRPMSYNNQFIVGPTTLNGITNNILYINELPSTLPMGGNMIVTGKAKTALGQIKSVEVLSSGFGYCDNESVTLVPHDSTLPSLVGATSVLGGSGISAGSWLTHTSHLNWSTYIHDNYYYQEYSYDVKSSYSLDKYKDVLMNITHVSGNELFGSVVKSVVYPETYIYDGSVQVL